MCVLVRPKLVGMFKHTGELFRFLATAAAFVCGIQGWLKALVGSIDSCQAWRYVVHLFETADQLHCVTPTRLSCTEGSYRGSCRLLCENTNA